MKERQELILDAAENAFTLHGFKESSVREIAGAAGVSSAMLSYYFHSKEKLLEAVLERRIRRFRGGPNLMKTELMNTSEKLLSIINGQIKMIAANTGFFQFILREHHISSSPESAAIINKYLGQRLLAIKAVLAEGVEKGEFKPMDTDLTSLAISGAYVNCLLNPGFITGIVSPASLCKRLNVLFEAYIHTLTTQNST